MNDPFGLRLSNEINLGIQKRLESEKQQINESVLCLDLNSSVSKVPVYTVLQIVIKKIEGESSKVDQLSEAQIVRYYRSILLTLKSEMKSSEETIVIESEKLPCPITKDFLQILVKEGFPEGNDLGLWWRFSKKYEDFFIPIVKIKKFLLKINRYQNIQPQKSSTSTKLRQEFLIKVYNSLSEEDQALLKDKPQGKRGIKDKVRKCITKQDFIFYFADIDHNFDNAWKAVRKDLKNKY